MSCVPSARAAHAAPPHLRGATVHLFLQGDTAVSTIRQLRMLKRAGGTMARIELTLPFFWTARDTFDRDAVARATTVFRAAKRLHIKVLAIVGGTPCWASQAAPADPADCRPFSDAWQKAVSRPPVDAEVNRIGIEKTIELWRRYLYAVEIGNEPNHPGFFQSPDPAADYVRYYLRPAAKVLRARAPEIEVVAGSIALSDGPFLRSLYAVGMHGLYDAISVHPYNVNFDVVDGQPIGWGDPLMPWPGRPRYSFRTGVPLLRRIMDAHGDRRIPLWLTEFGFSTCTQPLAPTLCMSDRRQASYLLKSFRLIARWRRVQAALVYNFRDKSDDLGNWDHNLGLVRRDFSPKAVYRALRRRWRA